MAFLIGNKDDGYRLYSDNGTTNGIGSSGPSDDAPEMGEQHFDSLAEFARIYNKDEDGNAIYTSAYEIKTTKKQDDEMQEAGKKSILETYDVIHNNCADACSDALQAGGLDGGKVKSLKIQWPIEINIDIDPYKSPIPNIRYDRIVENNEGIDVSDQIIECQE